MKPLIIISAIILFFVLLIMSKVRVRVVTGDPLTVRAGLGPVMIKIFPRKKKRKKIPLSKFSQKKYLKMSEKLRKKEKRKAAEEAKKKKEKTEKAEKEKKSLSERIEDIKSIVRLAVKTAGKYSKKITVTVMRFRVTVGGDDAAETAKTYGAVAGALSYLTELLPAAVTFRAGPGAISADADFLAEKIAFDADAEASIRLINVLRIGLAVLTGKTGGR